MMTDIELGWLAGLLEGEGSFSCERRPFDNMRRLIWLSMTDLDVVMRYKELVERVTGHTHTVTPRKLASEKHRQQYKIVLRNEHALKIMRLILPHMGERRKERIEKCIVGYMLPKPKYPEPKPLL